MLKRIHWKSVFIAFCWLLSLSGVITLMSFINAKKSTVKCTNVKILIPGADNFIEREEIDALIKDSEGVLLGKVLDQINIHQIEKKIKANPYIEFAKVYMDMDGSIQIEIKQRQPVLRVINASNQDYYIDQNGLKMPVSSNFTANVLVATGNIFEVFGGRVDTLKTQLAADLYKTALYIKRDTLWDAQIEQIYVDGKNDIELIPRVGDQRIILGSADSLEIKMRNLLAFYKKVMPQAGWETYKTINIKYTNQVVCEKNRKDSSAIVSPKILTPEDSAQVQRKVVDSLVKRAISNQITASAAERQKKDGKGPEPKSLAVKPDTRKNK